MKLAIASVSMARIIAQPALAREPAPRGARPVSGTLITRSIPQDFDLAAMRDGSDWKSPRDTRSLEPRLPAGTDLRPIAWDPPAFEVELNGSGAVLAVGAMGTRHKGMPKLAHVGIDWDF